MNDNGRITDYDKIRQFNGFKHGLVMFGGLGGIEAIIEQEEESGVKLHEITKMFDIYETKNVNQGTRFVRTEEAILANMGALYPILSEIGYSK